MTAALARSLKQKPLRVAEKYVQQTVREFLELDGWRAIRTDPVSDRRLGKGFGEIGMPDYLFIRYRPESGGPWAFSMVQVLWIEFKRKSEQPKPHQWAWHLKERERGALILVVDDIDEFILWYKKSGLCRRAL